MNYSGRDHIVKVLVFGMIIVLVSLLVLPTIPASHAGGSLLFHKIDTPSSNIAGKYDLIIITPKEFTQQLEPLVYHKNSHGVSTRLVTLNEIYDEMFWQGRDNAEKIKYFIKKAVEEWETHYILLIGGKKGQLPLWHCPVRYVAMDDQWEAEYISDLYYADIYDNKGNFSSWDADGDGVFGEWYYDDGAEDNDIDLIPDVAVGRLPCRNRFEVTIMVDKIIAYETTTFQQPWFNDMVVIAGDTYPESHNPNWTGYEGEFYGDQAIEHMASFNPIRLYTSDGSLSGHEDVVAALNNGCGFVYFVGHGSPKTWGNHPPDDDEFIRGLTVQNMYKLRNRNKLPVCVVSGCHNCQFDVSIFKIFNEITRYRQEGTFECWGWKITRERDGGSIATIGCTALGYTKEDKIAFNGGINELEVEFFRQYGQQHVTILGDAWVQALQWYIETYPVDWSTPAVSDSWIDAKVVQSWILFGDPSLQIGGYP